MNGNSSDRSQKQVSYEPILLVIIVGLVLVVAIGALAVMLYPKVSHMINTVGT